MRKADFLVGRTQTRVSTILDQAYKALKRVIRRRTSCRLSPPDLNSPRCELERIGTVTKFFISLGLPLDEELKPQPLSLLYSIDDISTLTGRLRNEVYGELSLIKHHECFEFCDGFLSKVLAQCVSPEDGMEGSIKEHFDSMEHPP